MMGDASRMSPEERERRLAEKLEQLAVSSGESMSGLSRGGPAPLTPIQRQIWFTSELEPDRPIYHVCMARRIDGPLDDSTMEMALRYLFHRHDAFRTIIRRTDAVPVQEVHASLAFSMKRLDLSHIDGNERRAEEDRLMREVNAEPLDIESNPPFAAHLIRFGPEDHLLLIQTHHIVVDGWSKQLFWNELRIAYAAMERGHRPELPESGVSFADYAVWHEQTRRQASASDDVAYWTNQLTGIQPLELPTDRPRPKKPTFNGLDYHFDLDAPLIEAIESLASAEQSTLFHGLLSAFHILLFRYSGQTDITVGCPVAGRDHRDLERTIGCFINTVPCRLDLSGENTFLDILRREKAAVLDALSHNNVPFLDIIRSLDIQPDRRRPAVYETLFQLAPSPRLPVPDDSLSWSIPPMTDNSAVLDLLLTMTRSDSGGLHVHVTFDTDLFDRSTIAQMMGDYRKVLEVMVGDPTSKIDRFPLVSPEQVRARSRSRDLIDVDSLPCVHETIARVAAEAPHATAVVSGSRVLEYGTLDTRADQLAGLLLESGCSTETLVGVCLDRSVELIVALLAILKAGGAFVPLDPAYPAHRLMSIVQNADPAILITEADYSSLFSEFPGRLVDMRSMKQERVYSPPKRNVQSDNLAYVIHTSGSTGQPKGVMIEHGSLAAMAHAVRADLKIDSSDRILQFASISFDVAVQEIFQTLTSGATLYLRTEGMIDSVSGFMEACRKNELTVLNLPTAYWHELTRSMVAGDVELPSSVRCIEIGGEKARPDLWSAWRTTVGPSVQLLNGYGPTETTVTATYSDLTETVLLEGREVPIGHPLAHVRTFVFDPAGNSVPAGVRGELHIGGIGVARGYLNAPQLTAERFVSRTMEDGSTERLYRTGDLVRYRRDGQLEFLGRIDRQVQIRGYRVEPGEIESAILDFPSVRSAVVLDRRDATDNVYLVAYVVPEGDSVDISELLTCVRERLPEYMVPSHIEPLADLPISPSGKIDVSALPSPRSGATRSTGELPASPNERILSDVWTDLLDVDTVYRDDNFFDLGGHSLLAMRIIAEIKRRLNVDLPLRTVFDEPTLAGLAMQITQSVAEQGSADDLARLLAQLDDLDDDEVRQLLSEDKRS